MNDRNSKFLVLQTKPQFLSQIFTCVILISGKKVMDLCGSNW